MDIDQSSGDDDTPQLSDHAMAALMEFYAEQNAIVETEHGSTVNENWVIKNFKNFILTIYLQLL